MASSTMSCRRECQWRCSIELTVSTFLFDLTRDQSTSHFHTFIVTFVYVSSPTGNGFASGPHTSFIRHLLKCIELVISCHLFRACLRHVVSPKRNSGHFVGVIAFTIICARIRELSFIQLVTYVQSAHHGFVAVWLQQSFSNVCHSHVYLSSS